MASIFIDEKILSVNILIIYLLEYDKSEGDDFRVISGSNSLS